MAKTTGRPLSTLTEAGGLVVGGVLAHVVDASTVEIPPPTPLHILLPITEFLPVYLPPHPFPPIPAPHTPPPQRRSPV